MGENMKKYLIALDMDGTLINSKGKISENTKEYLKKLNKEGHIIVISSGRPLRGIMSFYNELNLSTPIICYNGAYIYPNKHSNLTSYNFSFPKETILKIINDIGYDLLDNVILETNDDIYLLHDDDSLDRFFSKKNMCVHIGLIEKNLNEDTMTMLIKVKNPQDNEKIKNIVESNPNIKLRFWSGHWFDISEIFYDHINKGNALDVIIDYYNMTHDDVIAFGDAVNDIEMLSKAKYGFAMKNAEDDLKSHVQFVTEYDNDHDGIIHELNKIIKE